MTSGSLLITGIVAVFSVFFFFLSNRIKHKEGDLKDFALIFSILGMIALGLAAFTAAFFSIFFNAPLLLDTGTLYAVLFVGGFALTYVGYKALTEYFKNETLL